MPSSRLRPRPRQLCPRQLCPLRLGALLFGALLLSGCTAAPAPPPAPSSSTEPSAAPRPTASTSTAPVPVITPVVPSGPVGEVVAGLDSPWSVLRLTASGIAAGAAAEAPAETPAEAEAEANGTESGPESTTAAITTADGTVLPEGTTLISERDSGRVLEVLGGGDTRVVAEVAGVASGGEAGLLGLAARAVSAASAADTGGTGTGSSTGPGATTGTTTGTSAPRQPAASGTWLYAYFTSDSDNRIVRMPLQGAAGSLALGPAETVLSGIPRAANHDGGRIAFGPDGQLYATAGDAGTPGNAQNPDSLGGKILRMTPSGSPAPGNPFGTLVWSLGHRNPQGIGWDSRGRMWASEFGQNTWDELNQITPGGNYGWPTAEGVAGAAGLIDPVLQWPTNEASPSGLAVVSDTVFIAALRGQRVWRWFPDSAEPPTPWFTGEYGRIRDVAAGPDGTLWFLSNNTDGRGTPGPDDDRLWQVALVPG